MIRSERLYRDLQAVNEFGKTEGGWNRLAYTVSERNAVRYFLKLCKELGLETRFDSIGNAYARWNGENQNGPVVLCGSHLDTVRNGGQFDGALGVFAALEAVRTMKEKGIVPYYPLEIVAFACEESSRFGMSTIGSKAVAGLLEEQKVRQLTDRDGFSFEQAIQPFGYSLDNFRSLIRTDLLAFVELHIEQGPILEATGDKIGIVTAIAAPTRLKVTIRGTASHSGATAMSYRRDALPAAAEFILAAEQCGRSEESHGTVVTVGVCEVFPGAMNVVPGEVRMQVDIRSVNSGSKQRVVQALKDRLKTICQSRTLEWEWTLISDESPVFMSDELKLMIEEICAARQIPYRLMPSGAGHDAMNLVHCCPSALMFVPSVSGISHNPAEYTSPEDIAIGAGVLYDVLAMLVSQQSVKLENKNRRA
ncbi:Zn-dependent hydrolase [Collibacillus ludicampi]|uniref:Zn-dependent hydrolase n=1 Tax=Collibacillus ludicampi TaxID=2771369 RepID=A0AAV4LJT6_9BACL|nr:M20 family metallo-hydrolase [Collibacillus ludicampi]GIM48021.1 Zn-dependent hydrolase [Collibacillus ludicampi]